MSAIPNQHEINSAVHKQVSGNEIAVAIPTEPADPDELRKLAQAASRVALLKLIATISDASATQAQQTKAAEIVLEIAYGREKTELRSDGQREDAVKQMKDIIDGLKTVEKLV